jgi:hypothetical protein
MIGPPSISGTAVCLEGSQQFCYCGFQRQREQFGIAARLKQLGADTAEAVRLLIDLLELQYLREHQLGQMGLKLRR